MTDKQKTKQELIRELDVLRQRVAALEQSELARKRAEEALRESEEKYRAVFENTGTATVVIEENGIISLANAEFVRFSGYSLGEIEGKKSWTEFVVQEDLERMQAQHRLRRQNAEKALRHYEFRFVRRNGDIRNIYLSIDVILGTTKSVASLLDITERKQAEDALREYSQFSEQIIRSAQEGIIVYDRDLRYQVWNPFMEQLSGFTASEVLGKHPLEIAPFLKEAGFLERLERALAGETPGPIDFQYHSPRTGQSGWVSNTSGPLRNTKGEIIGVIGTVRDITERKLTEEALRKKEAKFQRLFDEAPVAYLELNTNGQIEQVNRTALKMFGHTAEEMLGLPAWKFTIEEDLSRQTITDRLSGPANPVRTLERTLIRKDGTTFPALIDDGFVLDAKGKILGIRATIQDITEYKKVAEALRESEEKYRSVFAAERDSLCLIDEETGAILDVNDAACRLYGYTREEMMRLKNIDVSAEPEETQRTIREMHDTIPLRYHKKRDGTVFPVEITVSRFVLNDRKMILGAVRDITERKRAEEATRRQAELLELTHDSISVCDMDGKITYWNDGAAEQYGWAVEEAMGKVIHALLKTQFPVPLDEIKARLLHAGYWEGELIHEKRNGSQIIAASRWALQKDGQGNPVAILEINNDITEKKHLEAALAKSEQYFRNVVEQATDGIFIHDINGRIVDCNRRAYESMGYTRHELLQMHIRDFDAEFSEEKDVNAWHQLKTGQIFTIEGVHRRKDGSTFPAEIRIALFDPGEPKKIIGIVRDVTERKRAEDVLRESEANLAAAQRVAHVGSWQWDVIRDTASWSDESFRIFGLLPARQLEQHRLNFLDMVHPEDRARVDRALNDTLNGTREYDIEYRIVLSNKTEKVIHARAEVIRSGDGKAVMLRGTLHDITEHKRAEQEQEKLQAQLLQAQKMESIGRLAGGVAHDFNNLLTVIRGYSELSLGELKKGDPLWENIEEIRRAGDRAADLTRQLLAFSRRQILEFKSLNLNQLTQDMEKMLRRMIGEDIELMIYPGEDLGSIKTDPGQMEQVIMNLAVNARDAMPSGGKLILETENVYLDEEYARNHISVKPGPYVRLSITDTGCGMTPEVREQVFEPFFTTKEKGKGTGLGLSTVYGIVKQSDGNIWVYSEPGKGTTLKIYLPRMDKAVEVLIKKGESKEVPRGNETVLVVEDEEVVRKLAVQILKKQGYEVLQAALGGEALLVLERHPGPIHLILTDVVMPGMSGPELVDRLRQVRKDFKVLYMSGYTDESVIYHGVQDGETNFIQKPFTLEKLGRRVREVLDEAGREWK